MNDHPLVTATLVSLTAVTVVGGFATTAPDHPVADHSCGPAHRYVEAQTAMVKPHRVLLAGRHTTLVCGGDDDSSFQPGGDVTLKVRKRATVKVWKVPEDPSQGRKTVDATDLPHWVKKNRSEPVYKIHGPADGVTSLVEQWHP
jgi:hypothetical protein